MAATNYITKIYNITRGGESVDYVENVISATGSSQASTSTIAVIGPVRYGINGTVGGATIIVQARQVLTTTASATFVDIAGTTATGAVDQIIDFPPHVRNIIKCQIASASTNTDFNVWFQAGSGRDIYD